MNFRQPKASSLEMRFIGTGLTGGGLLVEWQSVLEGFF